jgi:L-alanine-DL-glutamate epimerase-like enolase superfamily enzyme
MKISDLEFYRLSVPSSGPPQATGTLLVRLVTDSGLDGWGEAHDTWRPDQFESRRGALLPTLAGRSPFDIEELRRSDALAPNWLCAAVEMACWDLIGRAAGQPLCNLMGGIYRNRIPIAVPLWPDSPDEVAAHARELAEQGFGAQTLRSGGDALRDADTIAAVRDAVGERVELRLDGANHFTLDEARELSAELESNELKFFLDPIRRGDFAELASLERQTSIPLASSSGIGSSRDLMAMVRAGAARFALVDVLRVGGLSEARNCAAVAEAAGVSVLLGPGEGVGVGLAALLQLAASTPQCAAANPCTYHQLQDDVLVEPLELVDGMITVPQGPGLGVEVDRAKLERYQVT